MKKFIFLTLLTTGLFIFTSCDDDDLNPDQIFKDALSAKYPNASQIDWEKKKTYHVAECWVNNQELDVWFDASVKWVMTETDLRVADIPTAISTAIDASEYAAWRIDDVDKLEYVSTVVKYVIEVEKANKEMDLYYSEDGTFIEAIDVTTADDTHWPE